MMVETSNPSMKRIQSDCSLVKNQGGLPMIGVRKHHLHSNSSKQKIVFPNIVQTPPRSPSFQNNIRFTTVVRLNNEISVAEEQEALQTFEHGDLQQMLHRNRENNNSVKEKQETSPNSKKSHEFKQKRYRDESFAKRESKPLIYQKKRVLSRQKSEQILKQVSQSPVSAGNNQKEWKTKVDHHPTKKSKEKTDKEGKLRSGKSANLFNNIQNILESQDKRDKQPSKGNQLRVGKPKKNLEQRIKLLNLKLGEVVAQENQSPATESVTCLGQENGEWRRIIIKSNNIESYRSTFEDEVARIRECEQKNEKCFEKWLQLEEALVMLQFRHKMMRKSGQTNPQ